MTNLPQESVLNWSSEKPTFEEVKGKTVHFEFTANVPSEIFCNSRKVKEIGDYEYIFNYNPSNFPILRYAIIAEPLEPKPLWGVKPEFRKGIDLCSPSHWIAWGEKTPGTWFIETPAYKSEAEAITAWNDLVDRIEGER